MLVRALIAHERTSDLIARICKSGNVAVFREHSDGGIESPDPPRSLRAVLGGVLNNENIGSIPIDNLRDARETSFAFSRC